MVLKKRTRAGDFVQWRPPGHTGTSPVPLGLSPPPNKRARRGSTQPSASGASLDVSSKSSAPLPPLSPARSTAVAKIMLPGEATMPIPAASHMVGQTPPGPSKLLPSKTPKSRKKKLDPDAPTPEKRGAVFKKTCPKNILDRVDRVMSQRFFMIDRQRTPGALEEVFSVLGSTGNVYTVTINHRPSCNCPDAAKGNHCKHILFIFLKVLQVSQASGHWYQKALLTSELDTVFAGAPLAPNAIAHPHIREAHARATGKTSGPVTTAETTTNKRIPGPDDDCPICYETMYGIAETSLAFCDECGNGVHKECFQQWQASSARDGKSLSCVWCRVKWVFAGAGGGGAGASVSEGYINLASVSGASPVRDTSTYYHGPRRGQRYYGY